MEIIGGIMKSLNIYYLGTDRDRKYFSSSIKISVCCLYLFTLLNKAISVRCRNESLVIIEAGIQSRVWWSFGTKIIQRFVVNIQCNSLIGR